MLDEVKQILESRFGGVQAAMARAAGLAPPQLNRILKGKVPLSPPLFARIQAAQPIPTAAAKQDTASQHMRRQRLLELLEERYDGTIKRFADDLDLAPSFAWQITKGDKNIGGKLARRLEKGLDLPPGYLDDMRPVADVDDKALSALRREHLKTILDVVFAGSPSVCAGHLGLLEPALYQYLSGQRGLGEKVARRIERRVLIEPGAMDRLGEIVFPVRALSPDGRGIEIKLALLLSRLREKALSKRVGTLLHASVDIALAELVTMPDESD